jgi:type I restriction enzyme, S subunit
VSLAEVLEPVSRPTAVDSGAPVRTLGVRWYGAGCFGKDNKEVKAKRLNEALAGDIVYSKLFAWKGSFGVVPAKLAGVLASTEFPTFRADESMMIPEYFAIWSSMPEVWAQAEDASTGTTGNSRNRLAPDDFLDLTIELPAVSEQRKIVETLSVLSRAAAAASRRLSGIS